jgi:lysophospholipase L1-like esterase
LKPAVARLHGDVLNARDLALQRRGYYEELDVGRMDNWQWQRKEGAPKGWFQGKDVFSHPRADYLLTEIVPSASAILGGAPAKSNRFGMRDREYTEAKPPNTYRMVLLGGSHDLGHGVKDNETYENLVEDRLNAKVPDPRYSRYEILNMSVGNTGLIQRVLRLEEQGFQFEPDAVILAVGAADRQFFARHLSKTLSLGIKPPPGYGEVLENVARKAGIHGKMSEIVIERRLQPYIRDLYEWAFRRFAEQCRQRGVRPLVMYRPAPVDFEGSELAMHNDMVRLAQAAGLDVIDLSSAFDAITDRNTLVVAKWEQHTNALGHRLIAENLYEPLVRLLFGSANKQQASVLQKP